MGIFDSFNMCNASSTLYQVNEISKAYMRNEDEDDSSKSYRYEDDDDDYNYDDYYDDDDE